MKLVTVPIKSARTAVSINAIENQCLYIFDEYDHFKSNVTQCINDIKNSKGRFCYCHSKDEIEEIRKRLGKIKVENVIIDGEEYKGVWKVRKG